MLNLIKTWRDWKRFRSLPGTEREITFYAEDKASFVHFEPVLRELTETQGRSVCYLTSAADDPILAGDNPKIRAFYIGKGTICTLAFSLLKTKVMVMTMPDLESYHIKRSKASDVHYVYLFHSIVSTQMIYRVHAFDGYDTVLCVGPHHETEIRHAEQLRGLPAKNLVPHGYGRLDSLIENRRRTANLMTHDKPHVLVAPSWGSNAIIEKLGTQVPGILLEAGFRVTVRPHPMTGKQTPQRLQELKDAFGDHPDFTLETDIRSSESLENADLMISDFSGAAFEYAFTFERPVLFVDLPNKINNPNWEAIKSVPIELSLRERIGQVIATDSLDELPETVCRITEDAESWQEQIQQVREETVFHRGQSGRVGAETIAAIADGVFEPKEPMHDRLVQTTS